MKIKKEIPQKPIKKIKRLKGLLKAKKEFIVKDGGIEWIN